MSYLVVCKKRVREGYLVMDCLDFARYVMMSGMCALMREYPPKGANKKHTERLIDLFPYDGDKLYAAADELRLECGEFFAGRTKNSEGTVKGVEMSEIEAVNAKLDAITKRLAELEPAGTATAPQLRVVNAAE